MNQAVAERADSPVYQQLAGVLEEMIQSRSLRPGDRVPSVRQFSRQQRVSIPTALHAYVTLETRGLIQARPRSGFFVRARQASLAREPNACCGASKVTDFANLDPMDSILADHNNTALVPLGAAMPSAELLPGQKLARIMGAVARSLGPESSGYDMPPGSEMVRREIARRSLEWGGSLKPEDLVITNGCTEALCLALQATAQAGDTVIVESPTYFGVARLLRDMRFKALPVPVDAASGVNLDALERALKRSRVAACVFNPNFHNPVGFVMPDDRKKQLLALLVKHNVPLIEDDIYGDLVHQGPRPRCVKAFDREGMVILCSSFSKTLAPGYRVGYVAGGRWHDRILRLKTTCSLANATLPALAVGEFLRNGGYDRYLRSIQEAYRHQVEQMREAVAQSFPGGIGISRPQGSFVLWCELPPKVDSIQLFKRARAEGISIAPGPMFSADGGFRNFIRLNCGYPWNGKIERSVGILGQLVHRMAA